MIDLGVIQKNKSYVRPFVIQNKGKALLTINKIRLACGCTTVNISTAQVAPGQATMVEMTFTEKTTGEVEKKIYLHSNDPRRLITALTIRAKVVAQLN
ncbi:MAG: DUF1573 domain-containing protein [bacterium]